MFLTDSQMVQTVGFRYGEIVKNCMFLYSLQVKVEQSNALQNNRTTNFETDMFMLK